MPICKETRVGGLDVAFKISHQHVWIGLLLQALAFLWAVPVGERLNEPQKGALGEVLVALDT